MSGLKIAQKRNIVASKRLLLTLMAGMPFETHGGGSKTNGTRSVHRILCLGGGG
jgi:hypothetical protein